jgi:hypothetical protein
MDRMTDIQIERKADEWRDRQRDIQINRYTDEQ